MMDLLEKNPMELEVHVLLVGDKSSGKSSLISSLVGKDLASLDDERNSEFCPYLYTGSKMFVDGRSVDMRLCELNECETDGISIFLRQVIYKRTDVVAICVPIDSDVESTVKLWMDDLERECRPMLPVILVGMKSDLRNDEEDDCGQENDRMMTRKKLQLIAQSMKGFGYVECSAINNQGVTEVFECAVSAYLQKFLQSACVMM